MRILLNRTKLVTTLCCSLLIAWSCWNVSNKPTSLASLPIAHTTVHTTVQTQQSVWSTIRNDFQLDHRAESPEVQAEIRKLLADQAKLYSILKAAGPYIYFINSQVQSKGLPGELALIPFIESEFNPNDYSKKGATGLWQFMPKTAQELGIKIKAKYDGRRNVVASTRAAVAYFKDLGRIFKGDWYLAIAAYNCGQGKVASEARRKGTTSFWHLPLPKETRLYVPKLLAIAAIIKNPQHYGVELPEVTNQPYFETLKMKKPVDLQRVAQLSDADIDTLKTLNPDYNHAVQPHKDGYLLVVPLKQAEEIKAKLADDLIV